jgi:hypothetical protein
MDDDGSGATNGPRRVVALCPECGAVVDATCKAFSYLESLGLWEGIEDCWECSTALSFSVELDAEGRAQVRCERL